MVKPLDEFSVGVHQAGLGTARWLSAELGPAASTFFGDFARREGWSR